MSKQRIPKIVMKVNLLVLECKLPTKRFMDIACEFPKNIYNIGGKEFRFKAEEEDFKD